MQTKNQLFKFLLLSAFLLKLTLTQDIYPVAILHGMGDACANPGMKQFVDQIRENMQGKYVTCIEAGGGVDSLSHTMVEQSKKACDLINADWHFHGDISIVGLSQGGLLARSVVETCKFNGTVRRYIGIGGPQMGGSSCPNCFKGLLCMPVNEFIRSNAYKEQYQEHFGPAQMYNNAKNQAKYLAQNHYLPDLNNQKETKNPQYKINIQNLELMYLAMFKKDSMINPPTSAWFGFWDKKMKTLIPYDQQDIYTNDWLGTKTLNDTSRLKFIQFPGNHLEFSNSDTMNYFVPALLGKKMPFKTIVPKKADTEELFNFGIIEDLFAFRKSQSEFQN